jgi:hypothetical protein
MSSYDRKVNLFLKKFLPQQQITDNFLEYLVKQNRDTFQRMFPFEGVFSGGVMSAVAADQFQLSNTLFATDGLGHLMILDPAESIIPFENTININYHTGLRYNEIPREVETNVRTGQFEYTFIEERIGELGVPALVVDNGTSLTLRVDTVCESGVSHAGRKCRVWLNRAVGDSDAFYEGTVVFSGGFNILNVPHLLGQTAGLVSTTTSDYKIFLIGPTVRRNTNLNNDPNIAYLGYARGAGAGNTPSIFTQTDVTQLYNVNAITPMNDIQKSFLVGGGLIAWDLTSKTLTWSAALKLLLTNRSYGFTINASSISSIEIGDVLYILTDVTGGVVTITKVTSGNVPDDVYAVPIAVRYDNDLYFRDGALELKGDAGGSTTGRINDITKDLLDFIGATGESDEAPNYPSVNIVTQGSSLVVAISELDAEIQAILDAYALEQIFDVAAPTTVFNLTNFTVDASNLIPDIEMYWNGQRITLGATRGFKKNSASQMETNFTISEGEVVFRKERTGAGGGGGGGNLQCQDEGVALDSNVTQIDMVGAGVTGQQISPGVVRYTIPGAAGGNSQQVKNMTGVTIPAYSVLAWLNDGTVALADPATFSLSDFAGITNSSIADGAYGTVTKQGTLAGAISGLGAAPGEKVYLSPIPGTMTLTPPDPLLYSLINLGTAEPPSGLAQPQAIDLYVHVVVESEI